MKKCPRCEIEHSKTGLYCSRKCANVRVRSVETKEKIGKGVRKHFDSLSPEEQQKRRNSWRKSAEQLNLYNKENKVNDARRGVKRQVLDEQNGKCNKCGLDNWLGHPIVLELEHKDGNNKNNERNNLEYLCPNCHSLTPTWRGRNKRGMSTPAIPVEGYKSIRQYLIAQGLTPKGGNYRTVKRQLGLK